MADLSWMKPASDQMMAGLPDQFARARAKLDADGGVGWRIAERTNGAYAQEAFDKAGKTIHQNPVGGFGGRNEAKADASGVRSITTETASPGMAGFFGAKDDYPLFVTDVQADPNYAGNRLALGRALAETYNRQNFGMQGTQMDLGAQAQFRLQQQALAQQLAAQASGQGGPSVAEMQLQRSGDQNMRNALSMALAARGGNQIAALKQAQDQRATIQQDTNQQAAMLRSQEQMQARAQLADVLGTGRQADIGLAAGQAQLNQGTNQANLAAALQQQQQRDEMVKNLMAQGLSLDQANYQAMLQQAQFNQGSLAQQVAAASGVGIQNAAQGAQVTGAGISAAGTLLAAVASDARVKKNIEDADDDAKAFLDALSAKTYEYKDRKYGEGKKLGILVQDMERSELGKALVRSVGEYKGYDVKDATSALLAAMANVNKRLSKLERPAKAGR